ncbi:MAG: AI-2E family transporter [Actinobacteria bacterium]|nr:AI-2E family transporter [Actinomycetota bacterium]MBV8395649.1 AI-2E family transporter [Actinomycetota bacterium]MBV8599734.1 AI-2E family transporter [Actinomycetota bacterium]
MSLARKAFISAAVVVLTVFGAMALWKIRVVIALLFLALIIAAAMRPGVERLARHRVPRSAGVLLHYFGLVAVLGLLLWIMVPRAISQVQQAIGNVPTTHAAIAKEARHTSGIKHDLLVGLDRRLRNLPSGTALIHPAISIGKTAMEALVGIFFTFAVAAYWIFERERAMDLVLAGIKRQHRKRVRDTWILIDEKLGAFVRGQLLMITFVSTVLSLAFWGIGLRFWLLLGVFAGLVEMVPVIGPLAAGVLSVGVAATQSWEQAILTAVSVYGLRLMQDYVINPRVLGHAVGLSPLIVLVTVSIVGILFGGPYVILSVPIAAVFATLIDVFVRDVDPAKEDVPAVIFPAKEREAS